MYDQNFDALPASYREASQRLHWHWRPTRANEAEVQPRSPEEEAARRVSDLQHESLKRLDQCRWCLNRVMEIDREDGSDGSEHDSAGFMALEIELVAEAFYLSLPETRYP